MKIVKWIAIGLGLMIVAGLGVGYAVIASLDVEQMRGLIQDQAKKATGRELVLAGDIDLAISLTPSIDVTDVRFANAPWGSRPDMVSLRGFSLELSVIPLLSGDIRVNRLVLDGADVLLETGADGVGNWAISVDGGGESGATEEPAGGGSTIPRIDEVVLRDSKLTYRDGVSGKVMDLAITDVTIKRVADGLTLEGAGAYQGAAFTIGGSVGDPATLAGGAPLPLDVELGIAGAIVKASGHITGTEPDLDIAASGASLADLSALAGSPLPAIGPYDVKGHLGGGGDAFTLAGFAAKVGGSDLAGDLGVAMAGDRPKITATLTAGVLDLADFSTAGAASEDGAAAPDDGSPYVIPDTPLPLDALRGLDAELTLAAGLLRIDAKTEIKDLSLTLVLAGGTLRVDPFAATLAGGAIAGSLALDGAAATPTLALATTIAGLDYGALTKTYGVTDKVEGTVDVAIDLAGAGASPRAIASTLDGRTEIKGDKGTIDNKLLAIVAVGLGDVMGPLFGGEDRTPLNCVISRFAIAGGVATSEALVVDAQTFAVAGSGTIDLRDESLDMQFDTKSRQAALVSLAIPFNVAGTLKNPSVTPDPAGAALAAAKIAGTAINPAAALGAIIGSESGGGSGGDSCSTAVEAGGAAAGAGSIIPGVDQAEEIIEDVGGEVGEAVEGVTDGVDGEVGDAVEGVTEGLDNLFGSD